MLYRSVIYLAALCLSLAVASLHAAEQNTDRPGLDYHNFNLSAAQPELCQQSCEADERCRAWTYVKPGVQGPSARCWLKHSVPKAYSNDCCVSGVRGGAATGAASTRIAGNCQSQREFYAKQCQRIGETYSKMNCERHGYSGCALDVAGCFTPYLPHHVFNDQACGRAGYQACASRAYDDYLACLSDCNQNAIDGKLPEGLAACGKRCQGRIEATVKRCP